MILKFSKLEQCSESIFSEFLWIRGKLKMNFWISSDSEDNSEQNNTWIITLQPLRQYWICEFALEKGTSSGVSVSGQVIEVYICIGYYCFSNCQNIFISSPGQWVTTLCSSPGEYIVFEQQEGYLTMCEVRAYGKPVEYLWKSTPVWFNHPRLIQS